MLATRLARTCPSQKFTRKRYSSQHLVLGELFDKEREYIYQQEKREAQQNLRIDSRVRKPEQVRSPVKESGWEKKESHL